MRAHVGGAAADANDYNGSEISGSVALINVHGKPYADRKSSVTHATINQRGTALLPARDHVPYSTTNGIQTTGKSLPNEERKSRASDIFVKADSVDTHLVLQCRPIFAYPASRRAAVQTC